MNARINNLRSVSVVALAEPDENDAYHRLQLELADALERGELEAMVSTPGWPAKRCSAFEVAICDEQGMHAALVLLAKCCVHADPAIRLEAYAVIAGISQRHAAYHEEAE